MSCGVTSFLMLFHIYEIVNMVRLVTTKRCEKRMSWSISKYCLAIGTQRLWTGWFGYII
jgi:hypothetical protein